MNDPTNNRNVQDNTMVILMDVQLLRDEPQPTVPYAKPGEYLTWGPV